MSTKSGEQADYIDRIRREELERLVDAELELLLVQHAKKVNEGNNGVIFHLNFEGIDENAISHLLQMGINPRTPEAVKLLKIYTKGEGKLEYDMQRLAYEIVAKSTKPCVKVPTPILYRDLSLTSATKDALREKGVQASGNNAEVILMDFIPGEDLATILCKEALRRKETAPTFSEEDLAKMSFAQLHEEVAQFLGYSMPGGKARDDAEREFEREVVFAENAAKLYTFLQKNNFVLHPSIQERLQNTIQLLHDNNLCHRDTHERNVMIVGPYVADAKVPPEVYLVDFGSAKTFSGAYSQELYEGEIAEGKRRYRPDEYIINTTRLLTTSRETKEAEGSQQQRNEFNRWRARLEKRPAWQEARQKIVEAAKKDLRSALKNAFSSYTATPDQVDYFLASIFCLLENDLVDEKTINSFLLEKIKTQAVVGRPALFNRLNQACQWFVSKQKK